MLGEMRPIDRQEWADAPQATFVSPLLQRLYAYWTERRGDAVMPARADIDPVDMTYVLGRLLLVDVLCRPTRFRFRLHGSGLALRAGRDLTGKVLEELPSNEFRTLAQRSFRAVVEHARPLHTERHRVLDRRPRHYETLVLPLGDDRRTVDMLLVGLIHEDR